MGRHRPYSVADSVGEHDGSVRPCIEERSRRFVVTVAAHTIRAGGVDHDPQNVRAIPERRRDLRGGHPVPPRIEGGRINESHARPRSQQNGKKRTPPQRTKQTPFIATPD